AILPVAPRGEITGAQPEHETAKPGKHAAQHEQHDRRPNAIAPGRARPHIHGLEFGPSVVACALADEVVARHVLYALKSVAHPVTAQRRYISLRCRRSETSLSRARNPRRPAIASSRQHP